MKQGSRLADIRRAYEGFLSGVTPDDSAVRSLVRESWARSLRRGVNPEISAPGGDLDRLTLTEAELAEYRENHAMAAALGAVRSLIVDDLAGSGAVVALTDQHGRIMWVDGDRDAVRKVASIDFVAGSIWTEEVMGTNAPALALAMDAGVQIVGPEHFSGPVQDWNCAAAPVHDPATGSVIGAIDVTGGPAVALPFALATVRSVAAAVESELRAQHQNRRPAISRGRSTVARPAAAAPVASGPVWFQVLGDGFRWRPAGGGPSRPLSKRHAEILVLLQNRPEGMNTEQLAIALAEEDLDPVTIRAEISRLRRDLGSQVVRSRPYRLADGVDSDLAELRALLTGGDLLSAIRALGRGGLLVESTAPGIVDLFAEIREDLRSRLLSEGDPTALRAWTDSPHGRDDLLAWQCLERRLPSSDPFRAVVGGRVRLLDARYGLSG